MLEVQCRTGENIPSYSPESVRNKILMLVGVAAAIVAVTTFLAGCTGSRWWPWGQGSGGEVARIASGAKVYACDGGKKLIVRFGTENKYAMIIFPEREFRLDAEPSAAGTRFSNGRSVLSTSGEETMLEESGTVHFAKCRLESTT